MITRYPRTTSWLVFAAVVAAVVGLTLLWRPTVWVVIGAVFVLELALSIHSDRQRRRW